MQGQLRWLSGMKFEASVGGNSVQMDSKAPLGEGQHLNPKELVAAGLAGCTAMDVIALLKKHKQDCQSLTVDIDIETTQKGYPAVFTSAKLTFNAVGKIDKTILLESVHLSQTKYCGVSAMLSKALPIRYLVNLNGELIGEGNAEFSI